MPGIVHAEFDTSVHGQPGEGSSLLRCRVVLRLYLTPLRPSALRCMSAQWHSAGVEGVHAGRMHSRRGQADSNALRTVFSPCLCYLACSTPSSSATAPREAASAAYPHPASLCRPRRLAADRRDLDGELRHPNESIVPSI